MGAVFIAGDFVVGFFDSGDSGEGGGVICAVFGGLGTVIVVGVSICSVCRAGGVVSFFGCRRAGGVGLVVNGGGHLAAVGW